MRLSLDALTWVAVAALGGCFQSSIQPRTARLPEPGSRALGGSMVAYARAPGKATTVDGQVSEGNYGSYDSGDTLLTLLGPFGSSAGTLNLGLTKRFALSLEGGPQRVAADLRVALLDERQGAAVSVSAAAGPRLGAAELLKGARAAGFHAGFDVSRDLGKLTPYLNLYVTRASEYYISVLPDTGDDDCRYACELRFARRETRVVGGLGVNLGDTYGMSVVGYGVVAAGEGSTGRDSHEPVAFDNTWGASLLLTLRLGGQN